MKEEKELEKAYDLGAERFLSSRTTETGLTGFPNREIEQPIMFELVPTDLKGKKLLDIGCGPGIHLKTYLERGAKGFGIDISSKMIELAKKHCPDAEFKVGSAYKLEFEDNSFDIITSSLVLDHLQDFEKAAKEIQRVLKPGGLFIYSAPHPIVFMFFDAEGFVPTRDYFNKKIAYWNIVKIGKKFPDFPRILQEQFQTFLKEGFVLEDFIESQPKEEWKEKYPCLDEIYFKIPFMCFFRWKKS